MLLLRNRVRSFVEGGPSPLICRPATAAFVMSEMASMGYGATYEFLDDEQYVVFTDPVKKTIFKSPD